MKRLLFVYMMVSMMFTGLSFAQTVITDATIGAGQTLTLSGDNLLDGLVYVEEGATLNISPGTVIRGRQTPSNGDNTSALIITRGAKIYAEGTASAPIIFTAESDDINNSTDLGYEDRGLWGGVILLGYATTNRGVEGQIEGIPSTEVRAAYGGSNDHDNSGVMRYISIRHGGAELAPGDEINGLTFGAIGDGTTIEFIEVFSNLDDGYEWFGGTVNTRYLISAFCADDCFDYDEGWRGKNQFWFGIQSPDFGGRIGEHDGGTVPETAMPYAQPYIYNATYIGAGVDQFPQGDGNTAILMRDNAGGHYANSIITEFNGANGGAGLSIQDKDGDQDSRTRLAEGQISFKNNIWWGFAAGNELAQFAPQDYVQAHLLANNNYVGEPQLNHISRNPDGSLDPRPAASSPAASGALAAADSYFSSVSYRGAFSPNGTLWTQGWTALSAEGHTVAPEAAVVINDASIGAGETLILSADHEYLLDGLVYAEAGSHLIIEPGTVVRGKEVPSNGDNTSALIIAQGAYIHAEGSAHNPIIFTAETDDLTNASDLTYEDRGLWGGVIILGKATTNRGIAGQIEGIPSTESRTTYGGNDDHDDSGTLRYVSIRHGGAELAPGDEINGLTLGAVGDRTLIEYVEIFANLDDGVEWFGGTVNTRYLAAAYCADDAFDYDEGYRGKNQFWFAIQGTDFAGRIGEHDGGTIQETATPYSQPYIYNATYIGPGIDAFPQGDGNAALLLRDNAGGHYANSIITEFNGANGGAAVIVQDKDAGEDSRSRLENGQLSLKNNIWYSFGAGPDLTDFVTQDFVREHLLANSNQVVNPQLRHISRDADGLLDPRPTTASPAASGALVPQDGWFEPVSYSGGFDPKGDNWLEGWSALSAEGHLAAATGSNSSRYINHVTVLNGDFSTRVLVNNTSSSSETVNLVPYNAAGQALAAVSMTVGGNSSLDELSSEVFGANTAVSHFTVSSSDDVRVAVGYKVANGAGATAIVNESSVVGSEFQVFPGESEIVFDGMAIVNRGTANAQVDVIYVDAAGVELSQAVASASLAAGAKALYVFATPAGTARVRVVSNQPASVIFLRGTQSSVQGPAFLYEVAPTSVIP